MDDTPLPAEPRSSTRLTDEERRAFLDKIEGLGWEHSFGRRAFFIEGLAWKQVGPSERKTTILYQTDESGKLGERGVYEAVCRAVCASENGDDSSLWNGDVKFFPADSAAPFRTL